MVPLRVALISLLIAANTLVHVPILLLAALVKAMLPSDRLRVASNPLLTGLAESWIGRRIATLSGGQKARLEILSLELAGHNVLLLDEPTDNLDIDSSEALERAIEGFEGTVIAVSHDRTFLAQFDRYIMITDDGEVYALPDFDIAMAGLSEPDKLAGLRLAKPLTRD